MAFRRLFQPDSLVLFSLLTIICLAGFVPGNAHAAEATLIWDANSEPGLAGYRIYYGTDSRNYSEMVDLGNVITCSISNLAAATTYYFAVTAYDAEGHESDFSNEVSHTVPGEVGLVTEEDFVARFYRLCLNREPDAAGLDFWVSALIEGTQTGADMAKGFFLSREFINRNTSDEEYIDILYMLLFDRSPNNEESEYWLENLQKELNRSAVLDGFIYTREFAGLCTAYNIIPFWEEDAVEAFVTRFYRLCLGREPDEMGLDYWVGSLLDGSETGAGLAYGFVFSREFLAMDISNEAYLNVLYRAFFNRIPDQAGYQQWLDQLKAGASREHVLDGFVYSQEFFELCKEYGLSP